MTADVSKERTRNYLQQIKGAVVYKAVAMLASFLAIPMMIRYLGQEQFGVWSTLLTVMSWIVFFDLGVGNGLRNKVAEALAKNDKAEAANYIASGYSLIGLIALVLWVLVTGAAFFVPWQSVFNSRNHLTPDRAGRRFFCCFEFLDRFDQCDIRRCAKNGDDGTESIDFKRLGALVCFCTVQNNGCNHNLPRLSLRSLLGHCKHRVELVVLPRTSRITTKTLS
jgi:hypothetical protein